jgi:pimeloyl-ACP methyl ester carboxylesterase
MQVTRGDGSVIAYEVVGEPDATPVLFCHGPADSRLYARAIPGARLQLHPGQGHFSILGAGREMLAPLTGS